jgi:GH24 family phage-related lysozyme (muramidase)
MAKAKTSRLTEIYLAQKSTGGGLASALAERAKEKYDPRQVFNQSGLLAALLPSVFKAYKSPSKSALKRPSSMVDKSLASSFSPTLENKIDLLANESKITQINTKITAKNSSVLPMMARDMNLTRQNIQKIAKIQAGSAATKADMFFKRSAEREKEYESKKGKEVALGKTASTGKDSKGGLGIMGLLGGAASGIGGALSGVAGIAGGVLGSLGGIVTSILGGIGSLVGGAFSGIFSVLGSALGGMGIYGVILAGVVGFSLYSLWKSLDFSGVGSGIGDSLSSIKEALSGLYDELDKMTGGKLSEFVEDTKKMFQGTINKIAAGLDTAISLFKDLGTAVLKDMYGFMTNLFQENKGKILGMIAIGAMGAMGGFSTLTGAAVSLAVAAAMAAYGKMTGEKTVDEAKSENEALKLELQKTMKEGKQVATYDEMGNVTGYTTAGGRAAELEEKIKANEAFIREKEARTSNTQQALGRFSGGNIADEYGRNLAIREGTSPTPIFGQEGPATEKQRTTAVSTAKEFAGKTGADFIASMEGFAGKAYLDPPGNTKGQYSVGYGHLITEAEAKQGFINLGDGKKITVKGPGGKDTVVSKEEAKALLNSDLPKYEAVASKGVGVDAWTKLNQDQRNALTSLAYNGGPGQINYLVKQGLRDAILKGDNAAASKIIYEKGWKTSGGKYLAGLDTRRLKESTLFGGGVMEAPTQMAQSPTPAKETPGKKVEKPVQTASMTFPLTPSSGKEVSDGTVRVAEAKTIAKETPANITNITNNNVRSSSGSGATASASVYDDLFANLVARAI